MDIIDRIILTICSICLVLLSICLIIFPFDQLNLLSIYDINMVLKAVQGNYIVSILGLVFLFASIKLLILGLVGYRDKSRTTYLIQRTEYGEINISSETIVGLVESVSNKFTGVKHIKTRVDILESQLYISLKGEVSPEINITETTKELQAKVKDHVESCTGVSVNDIKVVISNVTAPIRNVK